MVLFVIPVRDETSSVATIFANQAAMDAADTTGFINGQLFIEEEDEFLYFWDEDADDYKLVADLGLRQLEDLGDVSLSSIASENILSYDDALVRDDGTTGGWENITKVEFLAGEVTARTDADNALGVRIDDERTYVDNEIAAEVSNRESADTDIRTDFAAADAQIEIDYIAADVIVLQAAEDYTDTQIANVDSIGDFTVPVDTQTPLVETDLASMGYVDDQVAALDSIGDFTVPVDTQVPTVETDIASMGYVDDQVSSIGTVTFVPFLFGMYANQDEANAAIPTGVTYSEDTGFVGNLGDWHVSPVETGDNFQLQGLEEDETTPIVFAATPLGAIGPTGMAGADGINILPVFANTEFFATNTQSLTPGANHYVAFHQYTGDTPPGFTDSYRYNFCRLCR